MQRSACAAAAVVACVLSAVAGSGDTVEAQGADRSVYVGGYGGAVFDNAEPFSESICPDESTLLWGFHGGVELWRYLAVEAGVSNHHELSDRCVDGLVPPPPENGTRTIRFFDRDISGYPHVTPEGRLRVRSPRFAGVVSGRLAVGGAWFAAKGIGAWLAGLGLRASFGRLTVSLDVERWWFGVPFDDQVETFRDGEIVSVRDDPGEISANPVQLRLGVSWPVF